MSLFGSVGHFFSNAAHVAGRAIDHAAHAVSTVAKGVGGVVSHIPIVGAPVSAVFSSAWHLATAPLEAAVAVAHGQRIDHAVLGRLEKSVQDVHTLASYASVVASMVPGVGTGVAAALGAGAALMNGQSISDALVAGVASAVPGGALASAALKMGYQGVQAAATHSKLDLESFAKTGMGGITDSLGLPPAAKTALMAGVTMTSQLAHGVPVDKAIPGAAIEGLPVPHDVKTAMHQANDLAHALASGQRVDKAILAQSDHILQYLPVSDGLKKQVKDAVHTGKGIMTAKNPGQMLSVALQSGLADKLLTSSGLSKQAHAALTTGMALGTGVTKQAQRINELTHNAAGKLLESGVQLAKTVPAVAEGRRLVAKGTHGFDLAHGLLGMHASVFDIIATRNLLKTPDDLKGFDMAMAQKIGLVIAPPTPKLSHAARAGYTMTVGMQGYHPENKAAMMKNIAASPSASVGAHVAVQHVAEEKEGFIVKLLKLFGLYHPSHA